MTLLVVAAALAGDPVTYEPGEGLIFDAADSGAEARVSLWAQPTVGVAADEDGVIGQLDVRRARLDVILFPKDWLRVEVGFSGDRGRVGLRDAEVQIRLDDAFVLRMGRGRPPTGLERETSSRWLATLERSAIADLVPGRADQIGVDGEAGPVFWRTAVSRVDGDELPQGAPLALDVAARVGVRGDHVGASARLLASPRPMGSLGARLRDPSDGTGLAAARPWTGLGAGGGADVAGWTGRTRAVAEGAVLREGVEDGTVSGHTLHAAGYAFVGVRLSDEEKRLEHDDSFAISRGTELIARIDGAATWPAPGAGDRATGLGVAVAASYAPVKSLRAQLEVQAGASWVGDAAATPGGAVRLWLAVGP